MAAIFQESSKKGVRAVFTRNSKKSRVARLTQEDCLVVIVILEGLARIRMDLVEFTHAVRCSFDPLSEPHLRGMAAASLDQLKRSDQV